MSRHYFQRNRHCPVGEAVQAYIFLHGLGLSPAVVGDAESLTEEAGRKVDPMQVYEGISEGFRPVGAQKAALRAGERS